MVCGWASVPTSKSLGVRRSNRSRTLPPTRYALYPALERRYRTFRASGSICWREIGCSRRGRMRGGKASGLWISEGRLVGFAFVSLVAGLRRQDVGPGYSSRNV